jgi:pimeloyl-ACP methyl ester carboxylesterase
MTTYVLVHGAWHGGWCWRHVARALVAAGDEAHAPTLTGLGERAHLLSPEIGLETHVQDVLGVLQWEDLRDVVLVGHSYAGLVVDAVADRAAERVARIVYLDAIVVPDGDCLFDHLHAPTRAHFEEQADAQGAGWLVPVSAANAQFLGLHDDEGGRQALARLTPHPLRTFRDPLRLSAEFPRVPRSYVQCIGDRPAGQPRPPHAQGIEDCHELRTGHDAMLTAPREVAGLLRRLSVTSARRSRRARSPTR